MVCLGNICRSPTAQAVFQARLDARALSGHISVDSAGTGHWMVGRCADRRATAAAARRNYDLSGLIARQVTESDFHLFDYIVAMDWDNYAALEAMAPDGHRARLSMLLDHSERYAGDVPDPYGGNDKDFELVLDMVEEACDRLIDTIVQEHE